MSASHEQGALGASLSDPMTQPQEQGASAARTAGQVAHDAYWQEPEGTAFWNIHPQQVRDGWERAAAAVQALASPADSAEMTAGAEPRIFKDGDAWCCLLGENLQDGIAGFGNTPDAALRQFRKRLTGNLCSLLRGGLTVADDALREIAHDVPGASWLLEQEAEGRGPLPAIKRVLELSPAPATPPGVPDSVRALSEAATQGAWVFERMHDDFVGVYSDDRTGSVIANFAGFHAAPRPKAEQDANARFAAEAVNYVRTLISAHPAGQSTGQGADLRKTLTRIRDFAGSSILVRNDALDHIYVVASKALDPNSPITEQAARPAPDGTRTGKVGVAETVAALIIANPDKAQQAIKNPALWGWFCGQIAASGVSYEIGKAHLYALLDALAARPAAPEAQGAERVRHVKRGTEYEVLGEAEAQVSVGQTVYANVPEGAYVFREVKDGDNLTVYRGSDGKLWCRFTDEFRDGRFEPAPPSSGQGGH